MNMVRPHANHQFRLLTLLDKLGLSSPKESLQELKILNILRMANLVFDGG